MGKNKNKNRPIEDIQLPESITAEPQTTPNAHMGLNEVTTFYEAYYLCACGDIVRFNYDTRPQIPGTLTLDHDLENIGIRTDTAILVEICEIIGTVVWRSNDNRTN